MILFETPALFICILLILIVLGITIVVKMHIFWNHLKIHHHEKWVYLTSTKTKGPGLHNTERLFDFFWGPDNFEDVYVKKIKKQIHLLVICQFVGILSWFLCMFISAIVNFKR